MICDVHAHYIPQKFGDFMGDRWGPRVGPAVKVKEGIAKHPVSDWATDIVGRLELMDAAGVEKQVLSPHRPPYLPDEKEGVAGDPPAQRRLCRAGAQAPRPHRLLCDAAAAAYRRGLKEMERGLDQLGCVGVNMHISCFDRSVAETEFEPIYAELNRRGAILFVHPSTNGICSPFINDYKFTAPVGTSSRTPALCCT